MLIISRIRLKQLYNQDYPMESWYYVYVDLDVRKYFVKVELDQRILHLVLCLWYMLRISTTEHWDRIGCWKFLCMRYTMTSSNRSILDINTCVLPLLDSSCTEANNCNQMRGHGLQGDTIYFYAKIIYFALIHVRKPTETPDVRGSRFGKAIKNST